ncbi:MAG: discoidin domain-containing protein [Planctomycetaceae bacterium]|nr:discoidin domain-containing protein [Planctomycetaceae bacterium]
MNLLKSDYRLLLPLAIASLAFPSSVAAENPAIEAETRGATLLGLNSLSVNGKVHPHARPTSYYFEYGPTTAYGAKTAPREVPPIRGAYYHETWDEGWNGWRSWDARLLHFKEGGAARGHIRYESLSRDDHNHDDGIGTVHLAKYMYPGRFNPIPGAYLGAGDPDFRDAIIRVAVRGIDWKPNGTELMWWSQCQSNIEINPNDQTLGPNYKHPNWCYTGHALTPLLKTGKWERAEYRLLNDTTQWSYCGNNKGEPRYDAYWPIDSVQRHLNLDFFHMVCFVNPANRPTGAIDFDEFEVFYRNYSLVYPAHGARLIQSPSGSKEDPALLTDGWRHGAGHVWKSAPSPSAPLEFTYEFARPVTIDTVQIHQHPEWPAKAVEVLVSEDGKEWKPLAKGEIPATTESGPNYAFLLQRGFHAVARQARVRVLSGYKPEHWGLGEIEIFGQGARYATDDDWFHVTLDLPNLNPGDTVHYRLVAKNDAGTVTGTGQQFQIPRDARPHVVAGEATRIAAGTARVDGRLNPLGKRTEFWFEYGTTNQYGQRTPGQYGGLQITPRIAFAELKDLKPGETYHYRLVASNEVGTSHSADATFVAR